MCTIGTCVQEPLTMIDSTRLCTSLAMALRDRRTGIPVQPNRSLPLRPTPPIPTRSPIAKSSKDSPILKLTNILPAALGKDEVECSAGTTCEFSKNHETDSDDLTSVKVTCGKNLSDDFHESSDGRRIPETMKDTKCVEHTDEKDSAVFDENGNGWYLTGFDHSSITDESDDRWNKNSSLKQKIRMEIDDGEKAENTFAIQCGESLKRDRADKMINEEKMVPPLKLKKVLPEGVEEMMNYRVITGATSASGSTFSSWNSPEERASNPKIGITRLNDSNDGRITSQVRSMSLNHQKSIPVCPIAIPISLAKKFNKFVPIKPKNDLKKISEKKLKKKCSLPSMPSLDDLENVSTSANDVDKGDRSICENQQDIRESETTTDNDVNVNQRSSRWTYYGFRKSTPKKTYGSIDPENRRSTPNSLSAVDNPLAPMRIEDKTNGNVSTDMRIGINISEYVLDKCSQLEATSTLPLSPGIQEALNEHKKYREREKMKFEKKRLEMSKEESLQRRFDEEKMQEEVGTQVKETAEMQKKKVKRDLGVQIAETTRDNNMPRKKNLFADSRMDQPVIFVEQERERMSYSELEVSGRFSVVQDQTLQHKSSSTAAAPLRAVRKQTKVYTSYDSSNTSERPPPPPRQGEPMTSIRNGEDKLKHRRNKLQLKVQVLQKEATTLRQQMSSTNDIVQRTRLQQMINCNEKQIENLTKHLNKLSVGDRIKCVAINQPVRSPRRTSSSPEPPRLSPRSSPSNSIKSPKEMRDSPPVLPRVGLTIPQNLESTFKPNSTVTGAFTKFEASSKFQLAVPEVVNLTDDEPRNDTLKQNSRELKDALGTSLPNVKERTSCQGTTVSADTTSPSDDSSVSFRTLNNFASYETDNSKRMTMTNANVHQVQSESALMDSRSKTSRPKDIVSKDERRIASNRTVCSPPAVSVENGTNGYLPNVSYVLVNPSPNVPHIDSNSGYDRPFRAIDYGRIGNGQRDSNLLRQSHSNLTMAGRSYYQPLGAQDYVVSSNVNLNHQMTQMSGQPTEINSSVSYLIGPNEPSIPTMTVSQSQPSQAQTVNKSIDNLNIGRRRQRSGSLQSDAGQINPGQPNSHRIMSEPFPTLGNWVAQMSKKQGKSKRKFTATPATAQSATYVSPDFRVAESDMYKMPASTANMPRNNIGSDWRAERWQEQRVSLQDFYPPNVAPYYQSNFAMNPYGTAYGHPSMCLYDPYQLHSRSMNGHQIPIGSLNTHPMQHPLQGSQHYSAEMLKRPTLSASFQNPILHSNYLQTPSNIMQNHGTNVLHPGYTNGQFRISDNPAFQKAFRSEDNGLSQLSSNDLTQINGTVPSSQVNCNYLPPSSSQTPDDTFVSSENSHEPKSSFTKKDHSPLSSMTLISFAHMQLAEQLMNVDRNCETPHLGKVEQSSNILKNLKCSNCGQCGSTFKCLGCGLAFYCNEACQIQHWTVHVKSCPKKMPKLKKVG